MTFDPAKFLNTEYTDSFETKRPLIPEGDWKCYIKNVDVTAGNRPNTAMAQVTIEFHDDELRAHPTMEGKTEILKRETLFLDLDDNGLIKYAGGANWQLGQLRAACGQNEQGKPWNIGKLEGAGPLGVRITHREMTKQNPATGKREGTGDIIDNVGAWLAM
jgi:hypothetical protein